VAKKVKVARAGRFPMAPSIAPIVYKHCVCGVIDSSLWSASTAALWMYLFLLHMVGIAIKHWLICWKILMGRLRITLSPTAMAN